MWREGTPHEGAHGGHGGRLGHGRFDQVGGRRAAIATTALALAISVGAVGAVASSAAPLVAAAAPTKCHGVAATIVGTAGDDKIIGTNKADVIVAGAGDDIVKGRGGDDVICDRDGDDVVRGGKGDDVLRGAAGADLVVGGAGTDLLRGGKGKDDLRGGTGDDRLNGGKAVDDCDGGPGVNTLVNCENVRTPPRSPRTTPRAPPRTPRSLDVLANDTDPDGDFLLVTSVDATGMKGTVTITVAGPASLRPARPVRDAGRRHAGCDWFAYTISDGKGGTDTASVAMTINGTDDPPYAVADTKTVAEDSSATTIDVRGNDTDIDGGPKTITQVTQPASGTVAITNDGANLTYEPDADYCNDGSPADSFSYTLNAGSTATVSVTVTCVNDDAVAVDDSATVLEDDPATAIDVLANDTDVEGDAITIESVTQPDNGTVAAITGVGSSLTYEPDADYCNDGAPTDDFTYAVPGGSTATVKVTVTCVGPAITSVSPSPLVPGASATLTGRSFSPTVADNTVTIGGASATVTSATVNTLTVTVPCVATDDTIAVKATVNGTDTNTFDHPLQVTQRALGVGEATIIGNASEVGCNEITSAGGTARYVIAAYNTSTNPTSSAGIRSPGTPSGKSRQRRPPEVDRSRWMAPGQTERTMSCPALTVG